MLFTPPTWWLESRRIFIGNIKIERSGDIIDSGKGVGIDLSGVDCKTIEAVNPRTGKTTTVDIEKVPTDSPELKQLDKMLDKGIVDAQGVLLPEAGDHGTDVRDDNPTA